MIKCPLCNTDMEQPTEGNDVRCAGCERTWYATGYAEAPIASRRMRVRMTKTPEIGDKITDVLVPRDLCLYHANCNDGFASALVIYKKMKNRIEYIPVQYGQPPPDVSGKKVMILDFSYPRDILIEMSKKAEKILVIDHHKTAEADLKDLALPNVQIVFDITKSGCILTWEFFNKDYNTPTILQYVQDRDLWKFELPNSKEVNASLQALPYDLQDWLVEFYDTEHHFIEKHSARGIGILDYQKKIVDNAIKHAVEIELLGHKVLSVHTTVLFSEITGEIAKGRPFGVTWFLRTDGKAQYSLRSDENGVDVSEIAKQFGGGGHKHAAGFELDHLNNPLAKTIIEKPYE